MHMLLLEGTVASAERICFLRCQIFSIAVLETVFFLFFLFLLLLSRLCYFVSVVKQQRVYAFSFSREYSRSWNIFLYFKQRGSVHEKQKDFLGGQNYLSKKTCKKKKAFKCWNSRNKKTFPQLFERTSIRRTETKLADTLLHWAQFYNQENKSYRGI